MGEKTTAAARIREHLLQGIEAGRWAAGEKLPSEAELTGLFSVSRMTVHRVLRELAAQGLVVRERGRGTFAARRVPQSSLLEVRDIAEDIRARGKSHFGQVITLAPAEDSPLVRHLFGPDSAGAVERSLIVHHEDGQPAQLEDRLVDLRLVPGYPDQDFTRITPHAYLMQKAPLRKVQHELFAVLPTPMQQEHLRLRPDEPCFLLKRKTWSRDGLVSYAELCYPGSRHSFVSAFEPERRRSPTAGL